MAAVIKDRDIGFAHYIKDRLLSQDDDRSIRGIYLMGALENKSTHERIYEITIVRDTAAENLAARHKAEVQWSYERALKEVERAEGVLIHFNVEEDIPAHRPFVEIYSRDSLAQRAYPAFRMIRSAKEDPAAAMDAVKYLDLARSFLSAAQNEVVGVVGQESHNTAVRYAKMSIEYGLRSVLRFDGTVHYASDTLEDLIRRVNNKVPSLSGEYALRLVNENSESREHALRLVTLAEQTCDFLVQEYSRHPELVWVSRDVEIPNNLLDAHVWLRRSNDSMKAVVELLPVVDRQEIAARVADGALASLKRGIYGMLAASGMTFSASERFADLLKKVKQANPMLARTLNDIGRLDAFAEPSVLCAMTPSHASGLVDFAHSALRALAKQVPESVHMDVPYVVRFEDQVLLERELSILREQLGRRLDELFVLLEQPAANMDLSAPALEQPVEPHSSDVQFPPEGRRKARSSF